MKAAMRIRQVRTRIASFKFTPELRIGDLIEDTVAWPVFRATSMNTKSRVAGEVSQALSAPPEHKGSR